METTATGWTFRGYEVVRSVATGGLYIRVNDLWRHIPGFEQHEIRKPENGAVMTTDFLIYECHTCGDYRVSVELEGGEWVIPAEVSERCPKCGEFGRDLEGEDPDAYWGASERAEGEDEWTDPHFFDGALTAGERNH